jgi:hypothetical protein
MGRRIVEHVLRVADEAYWEEPAVRVLCAALCADELAVEFFISPDAVEQALDEGGLPPHVVIFDWEGAGFDPERNSRALGRLLRESFAYVQVYTHLPPASVEEHIAKLRATFGSRVLPTRGKNEVEPARLVGVIREAWQGTIAGEIADRVRHHVRGAVERTLSDVCSLTKGSISALVGGQGETLLDLVLAKVRDEVGPEVAEIFGEIIKADQVKDSSESLRQLMSVWYYFFPSDDRVRNGDIVDDEKNEIYLVVTASCDLARFKKKTSGRLGVVRVVPVDRASLKALSDLGCVVSDIGGSIIANHGKSGDVVIVLPNVPGATGKRDPLGDYMALCHARSHVEVFDAPGGALQYANLKGLKRRCTLASIFADAIVAKIAAVALSPGVPDLPELERERLKGLLAP